MDDRDGATMARPTTKAWNTPTVFVSKPAYYTEGGTGTPGPDRIENSFEYGS